MKNIVEILGFYKRKRDGSEFVLYRENKKIFLTNGINIWDNQWERIEKRYILQCVKVEQIDFTELISNLKKYNPFSGILKEMEKMDVGEDTNVPTNDG